MKKNYLFIKLLLIAAMFSSCDMVWKKGVVSYPDPNGSKSEQRAYHQSEIKKYQNSKEMEKKASVQSLKTNNMDQVRKSNDKQMVYERKIKEHQQAIDDLDNDQ
jgi:hypothetical protein